MTSASFPFSIKISAVDKSAAQIRALKNNLGGLAASTKIAREQFKLMAREAGLASAATNLKTSVMGLGLYLRGNSSFIHADTRGLLGRKAPSRWIG